MVVTRQPRYTLVGVQADKALLPSTEETGTEFYATDTGKRYRYNGTSWVPMYQRSIVEYTVFQDEADAITYCMDNKGTVVSSHATQPQVPLDYAFQNSLKSRVLVTKANYNILTGVGFAGFVFDIDNTLSNIEFDPGARLAVPNGYTGSMFILNDGSSLINFTGGEFNEQGAQQRLWTCFYLHSVDLSGVNSCKWNGNYIRQTGRAFYIHTESPDANPGKGWVNGGQWRNVFVDNSVIGVEWTKGANSFGTNRNRFWGFDFQCNASVSLFGFKNVTGKMTEFHGCIVWDIPSGAKIMTISDQATDTIIVGGLVASQFDLYYTNNGIRTRILADERMLSYNNMVYEMPTIRRVGIMGPQHLNGDGVLAAVTGATGQTTANSQTFDDGLFFRYSSAGALNDNAGWRYTAPIAYRGWRPYWKSRYRVNQFGSTRFWCGFGGTASEPTGDDHYSGVPCFMLGWRASDANIMCVHNDASGATVYDSLGVAKGTETRTIEIIADDANARWGIAIDALFAGGQIQWFTTDIPGQTDALYPHFEIEATSTGVKTMDRFGIEIVSDV